MSRLSVNIRCRQPSRVTSSPLLMSAASFFSVVVSHACLQPRRQKDGPKRPLRNFIVQRPMKPLSKKCLCSLQIDGISHRDYNPLANKRPLRPSGVSVLISLKDEHCGRFEVTLRCASTTALSAKVVLSTLSFSMRGARISSHHVCHSGPVSLTVVFRSISVHKEAVKKR